MAPLSYLDKVYAVTVITVLAAGLLFWLKFGKPAEFYSKNPIMHAKLFVVLIVGLISIYLTLFFCHRKGAPDEQFRVSLTLIWSMRVELMLLTTMPMLASLMARRVGL